MSASIRVGSWFWKRKYVLLGALLLLVFYLWIASSTAGLLTFQENDPSYYNRLSDGFLNGDLYLSTRPSPRLLELSDPYDPELNQPYRLHDASLYKDKYYLYFGPAPAVLLYIPARLLFLGDITDALAAALFAFVGTCFAIALLLYLTRRYLPKTPPWMLTLGVVGAVLGCAIPFTLRRAFIYEVAILAGFALMFAGLYFLTRGALEQSHRLRRFALASLFFGLAVGSRPTMMLPALLPLAVLAVILIRGRPTIWRAKLNVAAALAGPLGLCVVALSAYNALRFGSITEFGASYQLAAMDARGRNVGDFSYLPPGVWYYLLARAHITAAFPFFHVPPPPESYPGTLPEGYDGMEQTAGLLPNVPIVALTLLPWFVMRRREDRALRWVATGLSLLGLALLLAVSYLQWGTTMRYEVDFAMLLLIPAILTWFCLLSRLSSRAARNLVKTAGAIALLWSAAFGLAAGMTGYWNTLYENQRGTYEFLERATAPAATAIALLQNDGPKPVRVDPPTSLIAAPHVPGLEELSLELTTRKTTLYVIALSSGRYLLKARPSGGAIRETGQLCANPSFELSTSGWRGYSGEETLKTVAHDNVHGSRAMKVSYPDADLQGVVYSTAPGRKVPSRRQVKTSVWMKSSPGAELEMQVRIVNTDGTSSGTITSFQASGRWQFNSATARVDPGKTGDVIEILAIRRFASGPDSFLIDAADAAPVLSLSRVAVTAPGRATAGMVSLDAFDTGIELDLNAGLNEIDLKTSRDKVLLETITFGKPFR